MLLSLLLLSGAWAACPPRVALFISTPREMEALSGSCLQVACNFSAKYPDEHKSTAPVVGTWNNVDNRFQSSGSKPGNPVIVTGNLSQGDCSSVFYDVRAQHAHGFYFRLEHGAFKATAQCDPLQITVTDSPARPRIEISGELTEDESVTVTCSALTPCPQAPPTLTWTLGQAPPTQLEENTDGTFRTRIQQSLTLSAQHDGQEVSCSAAYPVSGGGVKTAARTKTLSVSHAPSDTAVGVRPSAPASVGMAMNLTCSCRGNPPPDHFVWFQISDERLEMIGGDAPLYSFTVTDGDRGRTFFCGCRNPVAMQLSKGRRLQFEGERLAERPAEHPAERLGAALTVKALGLVALVSTLAVFECWFRSKRSAAPAQDTGEADYVNVNT